MSTAAATADAAPAKGKKKLIVIVAAVLALVLAGGAAAVVLLKKPNADAEQEAEAGDEGAAPAKKAAAAKRDPDAVPTFVPLDTFTVNLADRDAERYAQVGITLEVGDPKTGEQIKLYMPAIRNNILMALADRTAAQLAEREGKERLAAQVKRETARALGYDVPEPVEAAASGAEGEAPKKKAKSKKADAALPVTAVHFSNFIIQ